jgi:hypothetical protein
MSRRQRQLDQLRSLCGSGAVARAIDLAFAHFADFGRDDEVVRMLAVAIDATGDAEELATRLVHLTSIA